MKQHTDANGCNCKNAIADIEETRIHNNVMESYGLCLSYHDYFVEDKCMWIVELKDGTQVFQDDDRPGLATSSAWKRLGYYVNDYPGNHIVKMRLRFGTHRVELPPGKSFYFYSKGIVQAVTQTVGLNFHIVGWLDDNGKVLCKWYKMPELVVSQESHRSIEDCQSGQIIGGLPT